jgi:hypothetical protein
MKFGDTIIKKYNNKFIIKIISLNKKFSNFMLWFWLFVLFYCIITSICTISDLIDFLPLHIDEVINNNTASPKGMQPPGTRG